MSQTDITAIILAAGKGTRMKSQRHKVLHPIAGLAMLGHVLKSLDSLNVRRRVLVVGSGREQFEDVAEGLVIAVQEPQLGTGHAVLAAKEAATEGGGDPGSVVLILYGDVPLITPATLTAMTDKLTRDPKAALVVLGFRKSDPTGYGRLICAKDGNLQAIVEEKDASEAERAIDLCNSGIMAVRGSLLFPLLEKVTDDNAAKEYYLTDIVGLARNAGHHVLVTEANECEVLGVNSRAELAQAEAAFQSRARAQAMADGASLIDPSSVFFSSDTKLGRDVVIEPQVIFGPNVRIGDNVTIRGFSHLEGCEIVSGAVVGPFARLRPGAVIGKNARIGNFVEVKKAIVGEGAKVNHLSYIGDAEIGNHANIGAGTITCNYDGFLKYQTQIGAGAFIGSNTALVAPVTIGAGAMVGAGSVITQDVAADALATARGAQEQRKGWAKNFREKMAARKARK